MGKKTILRTVDVAGARETMTKPDHRGARHSGTQHQQPSWLADFDMPAAQAFEAAVLGAVLVFDPLDGQHRHAASRAVRPCRTVPHRGQSGRVGQSFSVDPLLVATGVTRWFKPRPRTQIPPVRFLVACLSSGCVYIESSVAVVTLRPPQFCGLKHLPPSSQRVAANGLLEEPPAPLSIISAGHGTFCQRCLWPARSGVASSH